MQLALKCPITGEIMIEPYMLVESKQTYEKTAIEEWLKNHNTDPITNVELTYKTLVPNYVLQSLCYDARSQVKIAI